MAIATANLTQPMYELTDADTARLKAIIAAWDAYHGRFDPPLQRMPGQPDDNVIVNRCAPVVDKGVSFLFGKTVDLDLDEGSPQEAQDLLDSVWGDEDEKMTMLVKLAMNGAICGQAFLRIQPIPEDPKFRIVVLNPATVFVQTEPQDVEKVALYCIQYAATQQIDGKPANVTYREEIKRIDPDQAQDTGEEDTDTTWEIQHWTRVNERGPWTPSGDPITWPYVFAPIFGCQNLPYPNEYWGRADITHDLIQMNNALNLAQSGISRTIKMFGQPVLYATGVAESLIDIKPGRIIGLPTTESKIVAVSFVSDLANAMVFCEALRSDMDEQSRVPAVALGRIKDLPRGAISGVALELLFQPLIEKTTLKQRLFGDLIADLSQSILILSKFSDKIEVSLNWQNLLPIDDLAAAQTALVLKQLGISDATLQSELGYDPDDELAKTTNENAVKVKKAQAAMGGQQPPTESPFLGNAQPPNANPTQPGANPN